MIGWFAALKSLCMMLGIYSIWHNGTGIDELSMSKCMNHGWLVSWILAWDCYAWKNCGWLDRHGCGIRLT